MFEISPEDFVGSIIKGIVFFPQEVAVTKSIDERGTLITLSVAKPDMGRVIGKMGETINSVRRVAKAYGSNRKIALFIKLTDYDRNE